MKILQLLLVILLVVLPGCDKQIDTGITVTGIVYVEGQLLSGAVITLEPMGQTTGPNASTSVLEGRFQFEPDADLRSGPYRVRFAMLPSDILSSISASSKMTLSPSDAIIDPAYDDASQLSCQIESDQKNDFRFDIRFLNQNP